MNTQKSPIRFLTLLLSAWVAFGARAENSAGNPYADETPAQRDARMQWWREARFGLFIHWGVYAVPAGNLRGQQVPHDGAWLMDIRGVPTAEYMAFARQFNPVKYDPEAWVRLAKGSGLKYIVITSKHHDGFALFDSKASDWNVVKATPYGKDLLEPLAAACRREGIKLGFYYSQAMDWSTNGGATWAAKPKWDKAQERSMDEYIDKVAVPQVREILTKYGEFPAVLWWDTPMEMNRERAGKLVELLRLKPGIIHNNRLGGDFRGDTETPEQFVPATGYRDGRDFEVCMTINDTWGYKNYDHNWKSTETLVRTLIDVASKGGNYLLNVGPTAEGEIPAPSVERLKEIGAWMKVNGTAIYDTTASPFSRLPWGRCTKKVSGSQTTLYLHLFQWPADGQLTVPGLKSPAKSARLLQTGKRLKTTASADGLVINVPKAAPDPISTTLVLEITGVPEIEAPKPVVVAQSADGSLRLEAIDATLTGGLQYLSGHHQAIACWQRPEDTASWPLVIQRPGRFKVSARISSLGQGKFEVFLGQQKLAGTAPKTGSYETYQTVSLDGELDITAPGNEMLTVKPVAEGWAPMNLESVELKPVK
jgi:alpha-L-fucosidase